MEARKMNKYHCNALFAIFFGVNIYCASNKITNNLERLKRSIPLPLTTSIVIPCSHKHAPYLGDLIKFFTEQSTIMPDEMVISLSGMKHLSQNIITDIEQYKVPFKINLIISDSENSEAVNRNIACRAAIGDIIINQDADDLPHPQRIEIIKYFFEHYDIVHLMHGWTTDMAVFRTYTHFDEMRYLHADKITTCFEQNIKITNGAAAFRRFIFDSVAYDISVGSGVDVIFNRQVYFLFKNTMILPIEIYLYNNHLSSYQKPSKPHTALLAAIYNRKDAPSNQSSYKKSSKIHTPRFPTSYYRYFKSSVRRNFK
jgi:hypothetical protein